MKATQWKGATITWRLHQDSGGAKVERAHVQVHTSTNLKKGPTLYLEAHAILEMERYHMFGEIQG